MPQLDQMSFFSQVFWYLLFFYSLYFIVLKFFLPTIYYILKFRIKKFQGLIFQIERLNAHIIRYGRFHVVIMMDITEYILKNLKKEHTFFSIFLNKYETFFTATRSSTSSLQTSYYTILKYINYRKLSLN